MTRILQVSADDIQSYEPPEYKGLVYHDGVDSMGRPVIVVNADALAPRTSRKDAISYMQQRLEPIVVQVDSCLKTQPLLCWSMSRKSLEGYCYWQLITLHLCIL